jgi:hypothetical protein
MFKLYEIYTKDPETGMTGWDIKHVIAFDEKDVSTFKDFDVVIMREGFVRTIFDAMQSGYDKTDAVKNLIKESIKAA